MQTIFCRLSAKLSTFSHIFELLNFSIFGHRTHVQSITSLFLTLFFSLDGSRRRSDQYRYKPMRPRSPGELTCKICGKIFRTISYLKEHQIVHSDEQESDLSIRITVWDSGKKVRTFLSNKVRFFLLTVF